MRVWEGRRFAVVVEDGYEIADTPDAVAIVALDAQQRVVLVRQRRVAIDGELLELPAGLIDEGEEPLASAQRELREETGLHGGSWRELASFWTSPGFVNERVTVFVAAGLEEGEPEPDEGEDPLASAQRELREETGLHGGSWRELASFWTSPGFVNERVTVFLADGVAEGEPEPDEGEELEVVRWTLSEVEGRMGELEDATTLIGLLVYLRERS